MQHTTPCRDCPWRRTAMPGWVGSENTPEDWVKLALSESYVECHTKYPRQCAGLAIFRANLFKRPRLPEILVLEQDKTNVFATPDEFIKHHYKFGFTSANLK